MLHLLNSSLNLKILAGLQNRVPFFDVLFLTVCAAIGGFVGWEDIETFGEAPP